MPLCDGAPSARSRDQDDPNRIRSAEWRRCALCGQCDPEERTGRPAGIPLNQSEPVYWKVRVKMDWELNDRWRRSISSPGPEALKGGSFDYGKQGLSRKP